MKMSKKTPLVFLDVSIDGDPAERMVFELFSDVAPKTAENFRALCTGEKGISSKTGRPLHYKGSFFHRIVNGSLVQNWFLSSSCHCLCCRMEANGHDCLSCDVVLRVVIFLNETGVSEKAYMARNFQFMLAVMGQLWLNRCLIDEPPSKLKHDQRGLLSMALADRDARGSLFIITFKANHHLDRKYVVFGKLVEGHDVLEKIENVGDEVGRPSVTVKIISCGELLEEKMKVNKAKMGKDASSEAISHEVRRRRKHKKSLKGRRKRRKRYYTSTSESDTSSDSEMESERKRKKRYYSSTSESDTSSDSEMESESDSDSDSDTSSSSDLSSSSDDRRKKRKRSSRRDRYRHGKRRDKRRGRKRRRHDKRSKRRSKRASDSLTDTESKSRSERSSEDGNADVEGPDRKHKTRTQISVGNQSPLAVEGPNPSKNGVTTDMFEREEGELSKENGERRSNGVDLQTNLADDSPAKSRSHSITARRTRSKSMSISPMKKLAKSQSLSPRKSLSRSPSVDKSPIQAPRSSRSLSRSPVRRSASRSPPVRGKKGRSISRSPLNSPPRRNLSRTPPRTSSRKSSRTVSRSPVRAVERSLSRSPVRSSRRSVSRSSGRAPSRRSASRSPVRAPTRNNRRSYSKSPVSDRGRNLSRSPSLDGSPKRIRRGRGFSERFSYARRYRSPSPDRSPVRSYRYGSRIDRDRFYRRSPRRYRSPPRARTPPRIYSRAISWILAYSPDTEAEEAGRGVPYHGAQSVTVIAAVTAAVLFATVLLSRHPESTIPHMLRGGGHLLAPESHQYQAPHSTPNRPRRQAKTGQGHFLEAPKLGRRAWSLMEMVLPTLATDKDRLALTVVVCVDKSVARKFFFFYVSSQGDVWEREFGRLSGMSFGFDVGRNFRDV
ncbi:hypothetical protein RHMOL_Rhmol02G0247300 [Rhododendron molle]|uniref:Uncharacterized protein n=1 Tax=Rhododendron molle TaxID=49168 RepID=A0ACC0PV69_RHOML|nr:hypothetical protein RHMOL_Rhmol02G0247300 [Rhododendron molle]